MDGLDSTAREPPRWNPWFRVSPVQFEGEDHPVPRGVRLCCPAARAGDPVQVIEGKRVIPGQLLRVDCAVLHVRFRQVTLDGSEVGVASSSSQGST
jgi:hypothetical protein